MTGWDHKLCGELTEAKAKIAQLESFNGTLRKRIGKLLDRIDELEDRLEEYLPPAEPHRPEDMGARRGLDVSAGLRGKEVDHDG